MAKMVDNSESNFERIEREEAQRATRSELAPRLTAIVGGLVPYHDTDGGLHCGYIVKCGETYASIQPLAPIRGSLPDPIKVDLLDITPTAILQTRYPRLEEYLAANQFEKKEAPKQLDPVVKKERVAKVKVPAQAAVKGEKPPKPSKATGGVSATEQWLTDLRAVGEENLRRVMSGFKAMAATREALGAAHHVKAGKELFTGLWVSSNFSSTAKAALLTKVQEAAK